MAVPTTAAARPIPTAHRNSPPVGVVAAGMCGMARENVPKPVSLSSPTKMSAPTPAASSPGASTTLIMPPPMPAASSSRNAPTSGLTSSVEMAAKLPAAPMTSTAWAGASFLTRCTISAATPPPIAIRGASGPRTAPKHRVAREAQTMAGKSRAATVPPGLNPSAGWWPPVPGR